MSDVEARSTMRWQVEAGVLQAALHRVAPFARGPSSVSSAVRFESCGDGKVTLTCTAIEEWATTTIEVTDDASGSAVVPFRILADLVRTLTGSLAVEVGAKRATVSCGDVSLVLATLDESEWPRHDEPSGTTVEVPDLWAAIPRVLYAADPDSIAGAVFRGVHFGAGQIVACDGYRAVAWAAPGLDADVVVPGRVLTQMLRSGEQPASMVIGERSVLFASPTTRWCTALIEGEFPDFSSRLWRSASATSLGVGREAFAAALARLHVMPAERDHRPIAVRHEGDKVILSCAVADVGELTEVVAGRGDFHGTIRFNLSQLREMVDHLVGDEVTMLLDGPNAAVQVIDGPLRAVVMPLYQAPPR